MASMSTQFHATLEELATLSARWMAAHSVRCFALTKYSKEPPEEVVADHLPGTLENEGIFKLIFIEDVLPHECKNLGSESNADTLTLLIGRVQGERGLEESFLSTLHARPAWRSIFRDLKKHTKCGATIRNGESGATAYVRSHRYTPGAKALAEQGVPMKQWADSPNIFMFD